MEDTDFIRCNKKYEFSEIKRDEWADWFTIIWVIISLHIIQIIDFHLIFSSWLLSVSGTSTSETRLRSSKLPSSQINRSSSEHWTLSQAVFSRRINSLLQQPDEPGKLDRCHGLLKTERRHRCRKQNSHLFNSHSIPTFLFQGQPKVNHKGVLDLEFLRVELFSEFVQSSQVVDWDHHACIKFFHPPRHILA